MSTGPVSAAAAPGAAAATPDRLVELALRGLRASFIPERMTFAHTVRAVRTPAGVELAREGSSLRYTAIVALGLAALEPDEQGRVLAGRSTFDLAAAASERAGDSPDPGAVALAAWAAAEVAEAADTALLQRLSGFLSAGTALPTVDTAWMLAAAVASLRVSAGSNNDALAGEIAQRARARLLGAQGRQGIFPHGLPAASLGRWRAHVGCFADQVYPIQSLARLAALSGDPEALAAANLAASRICALQGDAGQWWWHYDARDGSVVEGFPVYSVHQHAMAPMALFDLARAGGDDHEASIWRGLRWLDTHPEVLEDLVSERHALIWRKVGRREPAKAARKLSAATTSIRPGWHLPGIDALLPTSQVDHECRPYELGWLLYAWRPSGVDNARANDPEEPT